MQTLHESDNIKPVLTGCCGSSFLYIFRTCQAVVLAFILSTLFIRSRLHPDNIKCAISVQG